jgi:hypothetical protein
MQTELLSTLEVKAKLEDQLAAFEEETAFLKKKADDYSNELRDLILKVRGYTQFLVPEQYSELSLLQCQCYRTLGFLVF